ncbi:serine/threonine-protein kinase PknH/PknJ [Mycobacterium sherrisii]|uniref:non-specific serine/threonine protein kinase n=1 Tax=Mycobacterium sherrisii TaxID=243061 RepID=A0A1E3SG93_9MYCO|nr:serine/threonine-protein kinase PknH/PknJ [Mycobacterium sherrisii]MCV7027619.1 sensor domain-containing protein [Mycobacterium sherrisii]MEC4765424.1 serine/threonine-protein kinase PknH/PknJ [Mycobacterium sherrisii]ODR01140.1 serine/threonine protein kinase [Mycobacterium sherrisii]ORW77410.1 serine/threonine protein kinase [Mycobacterium sherrisii]
MSQTRPGSRIGSRFGPYQLRRLLGRGGMGEVYEAYDTVKERVVALKLVSEQVSSDDVIRRRMQREAQTAGRLQEPHIVPIHDYGELDGQVFIDMRLIEGRDVATELGRTGPMPPPRAVAIVEQVASALDAAHRAGVIHRDIKPENILLTEGDFAYLVDFGIAAAATDQRVTKTGAAVGSWNYMAPERFGNDDLTYRVDIYALACLLYECLTGTTPFQTTSLSSLMAAHLMEPVPRPSVRNAAVPAAFDEVIARGMAKDPYERYLTAGDLANAALQALSAPDQRQATDLIEHSQHFAPPPRAEQFRPHPAPTPPPNWAPTQPATPWHPPPKRRLGLIFGTLVFVVAVVAGTGIWAAGHRTRGSQPGVSVTSPIATPPAASIPASTATPTVTAAQLDSILVPVEQINTLVGTTGIVVDHAKGQMTDAGQGNTLSDANCLGALIGFQTPTYQNSGYTAVLAQLLQKPHSTPAYVVTQGVVVFPSAGGAQGFVSAQAPQWRTCAGRTVTQVNDNTTFEWTFGQISGNPPNIALQRTLANNPLVCQHVLSAVSNVVLDVNVCAPGTINQARLIANMMASRLPR